MKLPSLSQIWSDYSATFRRFPLTLISALIGTIVALMLVEQEASPEPSILYSILLTTILALPLLPALKLTAERNSNKQGSIWGLQALGVVILLVHALSVPADLYRAPMIHGFRFSAFSVAGVLLLAALPFVRHGANIGFWQFNKTLVFRVILAEAFAVVLFSGLGLALAALDNLFGVDIPGKRYFELWILIQGLFVVSFVLSGIPGSLAELDQVTEYPRSLKILGQYVLAPLVLVYFVILYAYIAKIVFTWSWPQGWVGRLILGFSATGIVALFVLDPLREKMENSWIRKASNWYYLILLPLVVVLFLALWRRISEYGITEDRYLGLTIGVWLAFIAGYFLLSRSKSIKMIPTSLFVLTLIISIGPWGMFAVAERSQINRLESMLSADSILVDGKIQKAPSPVSEEHSVEISAILRYLNDVHGFAGIEPWFDQSLQADSTMTRSRYKSAEDVAALMGVEYSLWTRASLDKYFSVYVDPQAPISLSGYDQMLHAQFGGRVTWVDSTKQSKVVKVETDSVSILLRFLADNASADTIRIPLTTLIDRADSVRTSIYESLLPLEQAMLEFEDDNYKTKVVMLRANLRRSEGGVVVNSYETLVLYSRKGED